MQFFSMTARKTATHSKKLAALRFTSRKETRLWRLSLTGLVFDACGAVGHQPTPPSRLVFLRRAGARLAWYLLAEARQAVPSLSPTRPPTELWTVGRPGGGEGRNSAAPKAPKEKL